MSSSSQTQYKKRLKALMNRPENQVCSDCPERQPRWASLIVPPPGSPPGTQPIGAFCCLECSGSHRRLGVHIAFVRSINLDSWKEKEVVAMEEGGNDKVNAIFEARLGQVGGAGRKPTTSADGPTRERFIRDKYERRKYYDGSVYETYQRPKEENETSSSSRRGNNKTARHPSEAARLRAESRKTKRGGVETAPTASKPAKAAPAAAPPPPAAAAEVDLLDFAAFDAPAATGPTAPTPTATDAIPAQTTTSPPNLDLFANMTVSSSPPKASVAAAATTSPTAATLRKSNDDIMAMFNTAPSSTMTPTNVMMGTGGGGGVMQMPQQQQQQPMMMAAATNANSNNNMVMMQQGTPQSTTTTQSNAMINNMMMQPNMVMMQGGGGGIGVGGHVQPNMIMMQGGGSSSSSTVPFGTNLPQQQQQPNGGTMFMQQQGNAMLMQQQGSNTLMLQKNNAGNVMMMQQGMPQQPPNLNAPTMQMTMQQAASNTDDFGFPQAPMGSGPPMAQNGGGGNPQFYNAFSQQLQGPTTSPQRQQSKASGTSSMDDPFAQFGQNVFR